MPTLPSFDELKELHEKAPLEFEALREEIVNKYIESAPESDQNRLKGIQFQINARRSIAKNPMDACIKISRMMHEQFWNMRSHLEKLSESTATYQNRATTPTTKKYSDLPKTASILSLKQRE